MTETRKSLIVSDQISITGGRSTGFDYMRIILAALIVCWHSIVTSYGEAAEYAAGSGPMRPAIALLLPMFFALSGFLVAGSLERCKTLVMFLGLRAIRIFPALAVEVFISALVLGTILTSLPLTEYFSSPKFHSYFWNIVGHIHYELPGVFASNPKPNVVNGQLWTVPFELECYIVLSLLAALGLAKRKKLLLVSTISLWALGTVVFIYKNQDSFMEATGVIPGFLLVIAFLFGVNIYSWKDRIPYRASLFWASLIISIILLSVPLGEFLVVIPSAYVTVYLGLQNPKKIALLRSADYSYGIFLYGYALQQAFASLGAWTHHAWLNILICLPTATLLAALSWHFVEKPALGWRKQVGKMESTWLKFRSAHIDPIRKSLLGRLIKKPA